jgi:hypothetical protein
LDVAHSARRDPRSILRSAYPHVLRGTALSFDHGS